MGLVQMYQYMNTFALLHPQAHPYLGPGDVMENFQDAKAPPYILRIAIFLSYGCHHTTQIWERNKIPEALCVNACALRVRYLAYCFCEFEWWFCEMIV